uniref:Uncharacterized protein n=1 Tax=Heliothis virescens TaxID=7102 RepID=A0A2A4JR57_HELVI
MGVMLGVVLGIAVVGRESVCGPQGSEVEEDAEWCEEDRLEWYRPTARGAEGCVIVYRMECVSAERGRETKNAPEARSPSEWSGEVVEQGVANWGVSFAMVKLG